MEAKKLIERVVENADPAKLVSELCESETQTKKEKGWAVISLVNSSFTESSVIDMYSICKQHGLSTHMHDRPGAGSAVYITRGDKPHQIDLWFNLSMVNQSKAEAIASDIAKSYDPTDF